MKSHTTFNIITLDTAAKNKDLNTRNMPEDKKKLVLNYNRLRELACCRHGRLSYPPK